MVFGPCLAFGSRFFLMLPEGQHAWANLASYDAQAQSANKKEGGPQTLRHLESCKKGTGAPPKQNHNRRNKQEEENQSTPWLSAHL